ncbi:MAG: respiratory chain complex I subunit 1 family protein [Cytophagales bacterium]
MIGIILIFIASLFFVGIVGRTKSLASGRKGPGILQPMKDILRLLKKETIYGSTTSIVFKIAPSIYFTSIITALLVVPFHNQQAIISFDGDFVFFAYILALGKFFMIISALDTGSAFEGMGANREGLYSMLVEPAFFILIASFAMYTGKTSFYEIFYDFINFNSSTTVFLILLAAYILVQIAMIENSRLPIDDPKTHLELTMIHEVMILDNSGFDLAMILYASSLKFVMYGMLIVNLFIESSMNMWVQVAIFFGVQFTWAVSAGLLESFRARERMKKNPNFIFTLTVMSIMVFFGVLLMMNKI